MNPAPWRNCCASMMSLMMSSTSSSSPSEFQPTIADSSSDDSLTQSVLRNFLEKTWPSEAKRSEPSVMISLHSAHRALLVLARSIWVISGRSVGLHFRAVVCAQARQASRHYSPHSFGDGAMRAVRVARRWQGRLAGTHMAVCGARCGARAAFGLAHRLRDLHRRGRPDLVNDFACGRGDLLARGGLLGDGCGDVARRGTEREPLLLACASLLGDGHGGVGAQLDPGPLVDRVPVRLLHVFAVGRLLRARHARRVDAASCRSRPRRCLEVVGAVRVRVARCRSGRPVHSDGARAARVAGRGSLGSLGSRGRLGRGVACVADWRRTGFEICIGAHSSIWRAGGGIGAVSISAMRAVVAVMRAFISGRVIEAPRSGRAGYVCMYWVGGRKGADDNSDLTVNIMLSTARCGWLQRRASAV